MEQRARPAKQPVTARTAIAWTTNAQLRIQCRDTRRIKSLEFIYALYYSAACLWKGIARNVCNEGALSDSGAALPGPRPSSRPRTKATIAYHMFTASKVHETAQAGTARPHIPSTTFRRPAAKILAQQRKSCTAEANTYLQASSSSFNASLWLEHCTSRRTFAMRKKSCAP